MYHNPSLRLIGARGSPLVFGPFWDLSLREAFVKTVKTHPGGQLYRPWPRQIEAGWVVWMGLKPSGPVEAFWTRESLHP